MLGMEICLKIQVVGRRLVVIVLQVVGEFFLVDGVGVQVVQVVGWYLVVDEDEVGVVQMVDQCDEVDFGSIVGVVEY